jgi:hypothetical protein
MSEIDLIQGLTWRDKLALKRMSEDIETRAKDLSVYSNPYVLRGNMLDGSPPPSGVQIAMSPGAMAISWQPSLARFMRFYEVQIAPSSSFDSDIHTHETKEIRYTYYGGVPGDEYWVRVRAHTRDGISEWTTPVSSLTGLLDEEDIEGDALTGLHVVSADLDVLMVATPGNTVTEEVCVSNVTFFDGIAWIKFIVMGEYTRDLYGMEPPGNFYFESTATASIYRDGELFGDEFEIGIVAAAGSWASFSIAGFARFDEPAYGEKEQKLKITLTGGGVTDTQMRLRHAEIISLEFRR